MGTDIKFAVHNNSVTVMERGILERVFYVKDGQGGFMETPQPLPNVVWHRLRDFKKRLRKILPETAPVSHETFVNYYQGRRRTIFANALESLKYTPLNRKDGYIRVFGKAEKTNVTVKGNPPVRIISPRSPRYNIIVGSYLKPIEPCIYKAIAKIFGSRTVTKGMNAKVVGALIEQKWNKFKDPIAVSLDASRFDQHCSADILRWEHSIYKSMFRNKKELSRLLAWQLDNICTAFLPDGKIKYRVKGTRMSGDMNTATGNCLIMCALLHAYLKSVGVKKYEMVNNGDDSVVIVESKDFSRLTSNVSRWFTEMGYSMKVEEPVRTIEKIQFCQTAPVWTTDGYIMVRDPRISLSKDSYSIKPLNNQSIYEKWIGAIGQCGASLTGGIPICQEYYNSLVKASRGKILKNDMLLDTGMSRLAHGMTRKYTKINWRTRVSFWEAFDITPDMQIEVEEYFRGWAPAYSPAEFTEYQSVGVPWL